MSWKAFKRFIEQKGELDESKFILGMDIGNATSTVSFYNVLSYETEVIDMSGGYGKASVPSAIQYLPENKEWVFGEYALLNKGFFEGVTLTDFIDRLGKGEYIEVEGNPVPFSSILGKYIRELIDYCKNINPNAEIAGLVCTVPAYLSEAALMEYERAITQAGLEKQFIAFISDAKSVFTHYFKKHHANAAPRYTLMIDYGHSGATGGLYQAQTGDFTRESAVLKTASYFEDTALGLKNLDDDILNYVKAVYLQEKKKLGLTEEETNQLEIFAYQNKSLFLRTGTPGSVKLYFNFSYPPFFKEVTHQERTAICEPYIDKIRIFIKRIYQGTINGTIDLSKTDNVILTGGGFENDWTVEAIWELFGKDKVHVYKKSQSILSRGAALYAATMLGIIKTARIDVIDTIRIDDDYGLFLGDERHSSFYPFINHGDFWWRDSGAKMLTLMQDTQQTPVIAIYRRDKAGDVFRLFDMKLEGLPERPKNVTRLFVSLFFERYGVLKAVVADAGFGELFPKSDFEIKMAYDVGL